MTYRYSYYHHWCVNSDGYSVASFLSLQSIVHAAAATDIPDQTRAMVLPPVRLWLRQYSDTLESYAATASTYIILLYDEL